MADKLKTVNIKGKEYVMVNERLKYFRDKYPEHGLVTTIVEITPERVCMEAKILNPDGMILANGHAFEEKQSSYINKTSYIENCETSAWGRALANFGIGIDDSVGSADEVAHAMNIQAKVNAPETEAAQKNPEITAEMIGELFMLADQTGTKREKILEAYGVDNVYCLSKRQYNNAMKTLQAKVAQLTDPKKALDDMLDADGVSQ